MARRISLSYGSGEKCFDERTLCEPLANGVPAAFQHLSEAAFRALLVRASGDFNRICTFLYREAHAHDRGESDSRDARDFERAAILESIAQSSPVAILLFDANATSLGFSRANVSDAWNRARPLLDIIAGIRCSGDAPSALTFASALLDAGCAVDPHIPDDPYAWTPLNTAVEAGDFPLAELLLRRGASAAGPAGGALFERCPLRLAVAAGNEAMARLLLDHGAPPVGDVYGAMAAGHSLLAQRLVTLKLAALAGPDAAAQRSAILGHALLGAVHVAVHGATQPLRSHARPRHAVVAAAAALIPALVEAGAFSLNETGASWRAQVSVRKRTVRSRL